MLTAAFSSRLVAFAGQVGRPPGDFKLVVFAIDSLHLATQTPGNHDTLISSPDALPCWVGCLAGSVSPGGLLDFLTGPLSTRGFHDFFTILMADRGYKPYGRHAAGS